MESSSSLGHVALDRLRRCLLACAGLMVFAFGNYLQLQANIGMSPWFSLNQGLALHFPITYGQASILCSILFVCADLILRESIGLGTILNALVVGWGSDLFLALNVVPVQTRFPYQLAVLMLGIVIMCFGQYFYMKAALSCGPRDAFLVAVGKRFPRRSIGTINLGILSAVQVLALALGGPFGVGTFIAIFCTGIIMDLIFKLLRFEPRSIEHEGLTQTYSALRSAARAGSSLPH